MEIVNTFMGGVSRESANVLPNYATSTTIGTMTYIVDEDKTIHFEGNDIGRVSLDVFNADRDGGTVTIPKGNYFYPFVFSSTYEIYFSTPDLVLYTGVNDLSQALSRIDVELSTITLRPKGGAVDTYTSGTVQIGLFKYVPRD